MNLNYLTEAELKMTREEVNKRIAETLIYVVGSGENDRITELLDDVRAHERHELEKSENDRFLERLKSVCQEYDRDTGVYPDPQSVGEEIYFQETDKIKDDEKRIKLQKEYYDEMGWKY